jgi:hypothetical protein
MYFWSYYKIPMSFRQLKERYKAQLFYDVKTYRLTFIPMFIQCRLDILLNKFILKTNKRCLMFAKPSFDFEVIFPSILSILNCVNVKPQSHCQVSTATFCYLLKCYVSCHFLMVCTFRYVYTTLFYVFLRTVTLCHGLLEMQSLRSATLHYVLLRMYYASLPIGTV